MYVFIVFQYHLQMIQIVLAVFSIIEMLSKELVELSIGFTVNKLYLNL